MVTVNSQKEKNYIAPKITTIDVDINNIILAGSTEDPTDDPLFPL